jgi:hypothetical protein
VESGRQRLNGMGRCQPSRWWPRNQTFEHNDLEAVDFNDLRCRWSHSLPVALRRQPRVECIPSWQWPTLSMVTQFRSIVVEVHYLFV